MDKKVLIFIEDMFEDVELIYPYYRMKEEGYKVLLVGTDKGKSYKGKKGVTMISDISAKESLSEKFQAVIIPGGYAPDKMRRNKDMVNLLKNVADSSIVIAAICHGPWMLAEADIVKGVKITSFHSITTDMINAGAEYIDSECVVDKNIITSRQPEDLPVFCKNIIEMIQTNFK